MPQQKKYFKHLFVFTILSVCVSSIFAFAKVKEYKSGIIWQEPQVVTPGISNSAPSDAKVLFDGKDLSQWKGGDKWIIKDGYAISKGGAIDSKESFGDCQLHLEFASPSEVKGNGQGRGNSGVYLMGKYEVQILDSYENKTYFDGQCASIYKQRPPMVNVCRKPGEWQTYDIIFTAPRFGKDNKLEKPGYITVIQNGIVVQNHLELQGGTSYVSPPSYSSHPARLPLHIQFHGNPVRFRNIWIREIKEMVGKKG